MKRVMLYFGSFNPGSTRDIRPWRSMSSTATSATRCPLVVSPPGAPTRRRPTWLPELDRFEMAEIACADRNIPENQAFGHRVPASETFIYNRYGLRYLEENFGQEMRFRSLWAATRSHVSTDGRSMNASSNIPSTSIRGAMHGRSVLPGGFTLLEGAPLQEFAATDIRARIERGEEVDELLGKGVADYIRRKGLWSPPCAWQPSRPASTPTPRLPPMPTCWSRRGKLHYRLNEWGAALNDFNRALALDKGHTEARQYVEMVQGDPPVPLYGPLQPLIAKAD